MTTRKYADSNLQCAIEVLLHTEQRGPFDAVDAIQLFNVTDRVTGAHLTTYEQREVDTLMATAKQEWLGEPFPYDKTSGWYNECPKCHKPMVSTSAGFWCRHGHGYKYNDDQVKPSKKSLRTGLLNLIAEHYDEVNSGSVTFYPDGKWIFTVETKP